MSLRTSDELIQSISFDGEVLVGRPLAVPENSDADRTLSVRWLARGEHRRFAYDQQPVLEAYFVAHSHDVVLLTTGHQLHVIDASSGQDRTLASSVYGPLSLDRLGHHVAYTYGEPPELRVAVTALATGDTTTLDAQLYPSWSPALSEDGRSVVFVASPDASAHFYRWTRETGAVQWRVDAAVPFPTGPTAPIRLGDRMTYQSDGELCTINESGAMVQRVPGLSLPVLSRDGASVLVHDSALRLTEIAQQNTVIR
jgi:hypothetical protein